jgi:DNA invertase Pin-like site-specific DNA recombinase
MKAAIYLRISAEERDEGRDDLAIQREKCEAMATLKGWETMAPFVDEALNGTLGEFERPGLAALIDGIHREEIDVMIVSSLDRLATNIELLLSTIIQVTKFGAEFVSCKEGLDTSTPSGQFVLDIFSTLVNLERIPSLTRDEMRSADEELPARKRMPFGYVRGKDGPEIDIVNARVVRRVFELRGDGYSLDEIAQWLGFESVVPPAGEYWTPSGVKNILDNQDYYEGGFLGDSEQPWPPIL